jgi:hypothetical protein
LRALGEEYDQLIEILPGVALNKAFHGTVGLKCEPL